MTFTVCNSRYDSKVIHVATAEGRLLAVMDILALTEHTEENAELALRVVSALSRGEAPESPGLLADTQLLDVEVFS